MLGDSVIVRAEFLHLSAPLCSRSSRYGGAMLSMTDIIESSSSHQLFSPLHLVCTPLVNHILERTQINSSRFSDEISIWNHHPTNVHSFRPRSYGV